MRLLPAQVFAGVPVAAFLVVASLAAPARGQGELPEFLSAVPESPAFTLLGAAPAQVARPASARDFGLALINGVGADGRVVNGFAVEATLWRLIPGVRVPLQDYQQSRIKYLLANTQLSLGTAAREGEGEPGATDLGIGLKLTLVDRSDPMASSDFTGDLGDALLGCIVDSPEAGEEELAAELECVDGAIAERWDHHVRENWNATRLSFAVAGRWTFEESDFDRLEDNGFRAWLTGGLALGHRGMALGQIEYHDDPALGTVASADSLSAGVRVLFGSPGINGFGEVIFEQVSSSMGDNDRTSWSIGADLRVAPNLWISAGFGERFESLLETNEDAKTAVLANLKWGITAQSRLASLSPGRRAFNSNP